MDSNYTISVYSTRLQFPLWFVVHSYIVTEKDGVTNRYELFKPGRMTYTQPYDGQLVKNALPPTKGFLMFPTKQPKLSDEPRWKPRRTSSVSGSAGSPAEKLYSLIESTQLTDYPYKDPNSYGMIKGPNSNAYVQWIVDQVPECELALPWNAWGKGFRE